MGTPRRSLEENGHALGSHTHTNGSASAQQQKGSDTVLIGLDPHQLELVEQLRAAVADDIKCSVALQRFVSTSCLVRYLRARSWHLPRALKMLQATLKWRQEYRPEAITWDEVAPEAETGKQFLLPDLASGGVARDRAGRPVLVLRPRCENTKTWERQMKYLIYHLEITSWLVDEAGGKETGMAWLVDFVGYSFSNAPPVKSALHTINVLQNHYPERLGAAIAYLPPKIFSLTWRAINPFMDSATKAKVTFIDNERDAAATLSRVVDLANVEKSMGGSSSYVFNPQEYSRARKESDAIRQQGLL